MFLGRWVAGLRIASSWLAGMNKMAWPTFLFWNALGGIAWAASVALSIYFLGYVAEQAIESPGRPPPGVVAVAVVASSSTGARRRAVEARTTSAGGDGE